MINSIEVRKRDQLVNNFFICKYEINYNFLRQCVNFILVTGMRAVIVNEMELKQNGDDSMYTI